MRPTTMYVLTVVLLFMSAAPAAAQQPADGRIHGSVADAETGQPLPGANVYLTQGGRGAATDSEGRFRLSGLEAGTYQLRISYIGYETRVVTDIVVRPDRTTELRCILRPTAYEAEAVEITAGYFQAADEGAVSEARFSGEEIRRAPGSAGDVSRIMMVLPSVAKVNDQSNSLIVRGGSPLENAFLVDGIEVPNINHFPSQGASGGPLGMLPVDMIRDVQFTAGGLPLRYGDRLSSAMDITFRDGSRDGVEAQADVNFTGFGGLLEGPIGEKGSWLLSARRSYLDLLVSAIDIGTSVAPWYGDAHAKLVYDITPEHRLSLLALWSDDHNDPDAETAAENDMQYYGRQDVYNATAGLNWRAPWGKDTFTETVPSWAGIPLREHFLLSAELRLSQRAVLTAAAGVYTQSLPLLFISQNPDHASLSDPRATHLVLGASYLLSADTRLTLEGYRKEYDRFPVDPAAPGLFVIDELSYRYGFFTAHDRLVAEGSASSRGLELTVQKKLARDFYGLASAGWSTARYTGLDGVERARVYDNRLLFSIEGGYKAAKDWEFSVRWIYAGGAPYTPIDAEASLAARQEVLDASRINALRHPAYHSMNLRVDKRFFFSRSNLTLYVSVWNLYDRRNVAGYIWDDANGRVKTLYQWGLLPIFGVEWEM